MKTKRRAFVRMLAALLVVVMTITLMPQRTEAAGAYYIKVNRTTNVVTVYNSSNNAPVTAFACSCGGSNTPLGTFYTQNKYSWWELDGPSWGQYCTRITGHILFHSVWYYEKGNKASQSTVQYNKLGTTASHGCVRLTVAAAKWIYDNCPLSTKVIIFAGSAADDPLGKPDTIKVSTASSRGWDPTDPDPANPYRNAAPTLNVSGAQTVVGYGSTWNPLAGISATSSTGADVTSRITYSGSVNTSKLGNYTVTYSVVDSLGRTASASVIYQVKDLSPATISGVPTELTKEYKTKYYLKKGVSATTITGKKLTSKMIIQIQKPGDTAAKNYKKATIVLKKLGTYKISYIVTNPDNNIKTTKLLKIKVQDTKPPVIKGVTETETVAYNKTKNLRKGVTAKLVSGKNLTKKVVVSVNIFDGNGYKDLSFAKSKAYTFKRIGKVKVRYLCANPTSGKKTMQYRTYVVQDVSVPELSVPEDAQIGYGETMNLMKGVTAKYAVSGKNLKSAIQVTIKQPDGTQAEPLTQAEAKKYAFTKSGDYEVTYTVANPNKPAKAATVKRIISVGADPQIPVITASGWDEKDVKQHQTLDLTEGVSAALGDGTPVNVSIVGVTYKENEEAPAQAVTVEDSAAFTFENSGIYTVTYMAVNPQDNTIVATLQVTIHVQEAEPEPGPGDNPGTGDEPGPGNNPGSGDESDPGNNPGSGDESDPGNNPGSGDESDPGNNPGSGDESDPGNNPGSGDDQTPGNEDNPGSGADQETGNTPDSGSGDEMESGDNPALGTV